LNLAKKKFGLLICTSNKNSHYMLKNILI